MRRWHQRVAAVAVLGLVAGGIPSVAVSAVAADQQAAAATATDAPGSPVPASAPPAAAGPSDAVEAPPQAHCEDCAEATELRTATSRTFTRRDGSRLAMVSSAPLNYQAADGWHPIDDTLMRSPFSGSWHNLADSYSFVAPANLALPVTATSGSVSVSLGLRGASAVGAATAATVSYESALPGVDVAYTATPTGVKETLTLAGPSSPNQFTYTLTTSDGLTAAAAGDGSIVLQDASGTVQARLSAPVMDDSSGTPAGHSAAVSLKLHGDGTLTLAADANWLSSPDRVWPVVIDPNITFGNASGLSVDTYVDSTAPTSGHGSATTLLLGKSTSTATQRILLKFDLGSSVPAASVITEADLSLYDTGATNATSSNISVKQVTQSWTSAATWNTYDGTNAWANPGGDVTTIDVPTDALNNTVQWGDWYPTSVVQGWIDGSIANNGLAFDGDAVNVININSWENADSLHRPTMYVEYMPRNSTRTGYKLDPSFSIDDHDTLGVNAANGNLVLQSNDLNLPGTGLNLDLGRTYNGLRYNAQEDMGVGGWELNSGWDVWLRKYGDGSVGLRMPGEDTYAIAKTSSGSYANAAGLNADLAFTGSAYTLTFHQSQEVWTFGLVSGTDYTITQRKDRNGNTINFAYYATGGQYLNTITDTQGRVVTATIDQPDGRITDLTDNAGRVVHYDYDANGRLWKATTSAGKTTVYAYDGNGNLSQITSPDGRITAISYDAQHRVSAVTRITNTSLMTGEVTTVTYDRNLLSANQASIESGTAGWSATNATPASSTAQAQDGTRSLALTATGTSMFANTTDGAGGIPVTAGQTYAGRLSARAATAGVSVQAGIRWFNSSNTLISTSLGSSVTDTTTGWTAATVTAAAPVGATHASVEANYPSVTTSTTHYIDEAGLTVGADTAWSPGLPYASAVNVACGGPVANSVTDPRGSVTLYCFDRADRATAIVDGLGNSRQTTYTANSDPQDFTDGLSAVTQLGYDTNNNLNQITAPKSNTTSGTSAASTTGSYNAPTGTTGYTYLPSSVTDPQGGCRAFTYDTSGNLTNTYDGQSSGCDGLTGGDHYSNAYQASGSSCTNDSSGNTNKGLLCSTTDPAAGVTSYSYTFGSTSVPSPMQQLSVTQPGGSCTGTRSLCQTTLFDNAGRPARVTDGKNQRTIYAHDSDDRITRITYGDKLTANQETLETNTAGWTAATNATIARATTVYYDGGASLAMTSTAAGDEAAATSPTATAVTAATSYTAAAQIRADSTTRSTRLDITWLNSTNGVISTSSSSAVTDANTKWQALTVSATAPAGAAHAYLTVTALSTAAGEKHYVDGLSFGSTIIAYSYDNDGNLTQRIDNTGTVTFGYDNLNRLLTKNTGTAVCTPTGTVVTGATQGTACFDWDANLLKTFTDSSGTTTYTHDAAANTTTIVEPGGTAGCTIGSLQTLCTAFAYNAANRRTTTQFPGGAKLTVGYDNAGNETSAVGTTSAGGTITNDTYCYQDLVTGNCPSSTTVVTDRSKITKAVETNSTTVTSYYSYQPSGRLCWAGSTAGSTSPATCTTTPSGDDSFVYDANGNRTQATIGGATTYYAYDAANRLCYSGTTTGSCAAPNWTFDANGNELTGPGSISMVYNNQDQTTKIVENSVTLSSISYADVGQNERTAYTKSSVVNSFLSSPLGLDKTTASGSSSYTIRDDHGNLIGYKDTAGGHWYYLLDGRGSVTAVVNSDGTTVANRYIYDEWGTITSKTESVPQPYGYVSGTGDPTGLTKFGTRYYDPSLSRWTQRDPVGGSIDNAQATNRYFYAGDDPVNNVDPSGTNWISDRLSDFGTAVEGIAGTFASDVINNPKPYLVACGVSGALAGGAAAISTAWSGPGALAAGAGFGAGACLASFPGTFIERVIENPNDVGVSN